MHSTQSAPFYQAVLDSLTEQIAVIDEAGAIQWVSRAWRRFSEANGGDPERTWAASNYLLVCTDSAKRGDRDGRRALVGIKAVLRGDMPTFYFEYPCHSPTEQRWFMMRVSPLDGDEVRRFVVTHQNITERKLAEIKLEATATTDGLTGVANRRRFDEFLKDEWRRARRLDQPLSLALVDIDFFKPYNDTYGHIAGDRCLRRVGRAFQAIPGRPGDLVARYGGEEFAVVFGDTNQETARALAETLRAAIVALAIPHEHGTAAGCVTVSVGVATRRPARGHGERVLSLVEAADRALYEAKHQGRNRVCVEATTGG